MNIILTIFLLASTVCFVYRACQKAIKNLKNKYKKESLTEQLKVSKRIQKQKEKHGSD